MEYDIEVVLVTVDASDSAERALEYALAVAERYEASVHALYVVNEPLARGMETGEVEAADVADEHASFVDEADERAGDVPINHSTAVGFSPSRLMQHPGSAILDVAEELPADFVVVPREPAMDTGEAIGKSAQYVVEYASQPVLSV